MLLQSPCKQGTPRPEREYQAFWVPLRIWGLLSIMWLFVENTGPCPDLGHYAQAAQVSSVWKLEGPDWSHYLLHPPAGPAWDFAGPSMLI
jgi:hypothetical protein